MTCNEYRKKLIPWLDGELKSEQAAEMQSWISECSQVRHCVKCRKLTEEFKSFHEVFINIPQPEFPAFLHHRIISEIKNKEAYYHKKAVTSRWKAVPATIAILLSLYFGSLIGVKTFSTQTAANGETSELYSFGDFGAVSTTYENGGLE